MATFKLFNGDCKLPPYRKTTQHSWMYRRDFNCNRQHTKSNV